MFKFYFTIFKRAVGKANMQEINNSYLSDVDIDEVRKIVK